MAPPSYRLNRPTVVAETIDHETIILNLDTGCYFALRGSGPDILELIDASGDPDAASVELASRHGLPTDVVRGHVSSLVTAMSHEGILVAGKPSTDAEVKSGTLHCETFEPPVLTRYEDLKDLLLADPIHDVGEGGWPTQARAAVETNGRPDVS
jgi:hypothetical protein